MMLDDRRSTGSAAAAEPDAGDAPPLPEHGGPPAQTCSSTSATVGNPVDLRGGQPVIVGAP
jgi:hypothetical protein